MTFLLLALGGALAVGNIAALMNPEGPRRRRPESEAGGEAGSGSEAGSGGETGQAGPRAGRSVVMIVVGMVIVVWAVASLIRG